MAAIDAAIERCEEMLSASLLGGATGEGVAAASGGVLVSRTDPDDPWANEVTLPPWVEKRRCPTTGYWMTAPFESQCPMPEVFKGDTTYLKLLNPIIGAVADANEAAAQPKAEKKEKPKKEKKAAPPPADDDPIELFGKAKLVVAKVKEVGFVENSDKLYLCQVQVGPDEVRQVVTGLRKHVPQEVLEGATVMTIINLKTAKLAGQLSAAMIMCGVTDGKVTLAAPPAGATVGDRIFVGGAEPKAPPPKECKSKFWDRIKVQLTVQGGVATYGGQELVVGGGKVTVPDMPDGSPIS